MEFRILGPLEIRHDGRAVACQSAKQRLLLATLLLHPNEVVSSDRLIEALWGDDPPQTAAKALQVHVSQLRRVLASDLLVTRPPGYELRVADDQIDLRTFEAKVAEARASAEPERASALLADALSLWRGPPLADLTFEEFLQPEIARLEELRLTAIEDRLDADLALGRHAEVIGELERLAGEHPLRERIRGQLMLALYRAGRQADALATYSDGRKRLVEDLGLEPGRELKLLQQQVLAQDPKLDLEPRRIAPEPATEGLFGRDREFSELAEAIDSAVAGHGAIVLIGGEPGIGKSRLADATARYAEAADARIAVGRCWEAGGAPAFWPWLQALRTLLRDRDLDTLTDLTGATGRDAEGARFELFESIATLLRAAAQEAPAALFLDDLHAADTPSLLLLRFVAADVARARIAVVGCYRDTEVGPELAETLAELAREPVARRLTLKGVDTEATAALLAAALGSTPPADLTERVYAETRGNPLFAGELGRLFASEGVPAETGERLPIPEGVREAVRRRLVRQSERSRELLALASVVGREFDVQLLAEVSDLSGDDQAAALEEAAAARLVGEIPGTSGRLRFSHILVRDAIYDDLPSAARRQLHERVGDALAARHSAKPGAHLAEIAHHYVAADADGAFEYSVRAAVHAESQHGYEDAARHYRSALALRDARGLDDPSERCDLLLSLGEALSRAGNSAEAKQTLREAADIAEANGWPSRLARAALAYGGRFAWARGSTDPALVPLLERALAAVGERDPLMRARLLARIAAARRDEPQREARVALAEEALDITRRCDDPVARAYAVEGYWIATDSADRLTEALDIGDELIALGRQLGDREHEFTGRDFRVNAYWKMADRAGVDLELDLLTGLAEELRQPSWRWWVQSTRAAVTLMEGNFDEAEHLIHETRRFGEQAERWNAHVSERLQLFVLRRAQGRLGELEDLIARSVHEYPSLVRFATTQAHLYAELGDERRARASFDRILARDLAREHVDGEWLFAMTLLPDPCRFLGDTDAAARLYRILLPYADGYAQAPVEASFGSAARALGVLATVVERYDDAERHLDAATEIERRMRARPWVAHVQHDIGLMRVAQGDHERAVPLLEEAAAGYAALGMDSWAARVAALRESVS